MNMPLDIAKACNGVTLLRIPKSTDATATLSQMTVDQWLKLQFRGLLLCDPHNELKVSKIKFKALRFQDKQNIREYGSIPSMILHEFIKIL